MLWPRVLGASIASVAVMLGAVLALLLLVPASSAPPVIIAPSPPLAGTWTPSPPERAVIALATTFAPTVTATAAPLPTPRPAPTADLVPMCQAGLAAGTECRMPPSPPPTATPLPPCPTTPGGRCLVTAPEMPSPPVMGNGGRDQ